MLVTVTHITQHHNPVLTDALEYFLDLKTYKFSNFNFTLNEGLNLLFFTFLYSLQKFAVVLLISISKVKVKSLCSNK
jgi:hypothetical protein